MNHEMVKVGCVVPIAERKPAEKRVYGDDKRAQRNQKKVQKRKREWMEQAVARGNIESLDADVRFDSVSEDEEVNKLYFHLMLCFFFLLVFHRYCIRTWRNPRTLRS